MSSIPVEPTALIGRQREVDAVAQALKHKPVVTLWGPPGIGKTRVALHIAHGWAGTAWFCDLSAARDEVDLAAAISRSVVSAAGSTPGPDKLQWRLKEAGSALLVLDNAEQIIDAVAGWLRHLDAPELHVVVTSRERLRLRCEHAIELGPLSVDEAAVELFVDRARAARLDYAPDDEETGKIRQLVAALDGIPLAIELAAARHDVLGVDRLLTRLDERLDLLSHGARGDTDRQATLRGAIDWSWQLLSKPQQHALACLSLPRGSFTADTAEAVVGSGDALQLLGELRDRSLVYAPAPGRMALYESVRAFAAERLADEDVHRRYATYFLDARDGEELPCDGGERDNLLAVLEWALASEQHAEAVRAAIALGPVLTACGPADYHVRLLDRVIDVVGSDPQLLRERGCARQTVGDLAGAEHDLLEALDAGVERPLYAQLRKDLGVVHHQRRAVDQARMCYEAALAVYAELGDKRGEANTIGNLGALEHDTGRFEQAELLYRRALELLARVGDRRLEGIFLTNLGILEQEQGLGERARARYIRALELLREASDRRFEAIALGNLAMLEHSSGKLKKAHALHSSALELLHDVGEVRSEALCRARLGAVMAELGDVESAEQQLDKAEAMVVSRDELTWRVVSLHRSFVEVARGQLDEAARRVERARAPSDGTSDGQPGAPRLADVSDDARMVLHILAHRLATGTGPAMTIANDAKWFQPPGGARQDLARYAAARKILQRLAQHRTDSAGVGLALDSLFEAGWPGVTIAQESASNRVYVALAKLRKMGLKQLLLRNEEGYFLDPDVPLVVSGAGS